MNKNTKIIVFEGVDGVGKTTQLKLLEQRLTNQGYSVLVTKEPGTPLAPVTMELRKIMLDAQYDDQITFTARELISQAIRSIHIQKVVEPAKGQYNFILQDRGMLSALSYGTALGNNAEALMYLMMMVTDYKMGSIYDKVIILDGSPDTSLSRATSTKQEFKAGDAMELKGPVFMSHVRDSMMQYKQFFDTEIVDVNNKSIDDVHANIVSIVEKLNG